MIRIRVIAMCLAAALSGSCAAPAKPSVAPPAPTATIAPVAPVAPVGLEPAPVAVEPPSPLDPAIRRGTLSNGLTYYVMKHDRPEHRASLWLAVNAGSVLEDDDQRGLAHFVEHMAFNGTRRFPKSAIVDYLEKIGMRFGPDVNAYTSFDQTVYQLMLPTDDSAIMTTGLDILRDWAGDVSFDPVEVDKERGVVLEEWRLGRGAGSRINDKQFPILFQGSRYAERLPIGKPEILKTAPTPALVRFYKDWYRPDQMAVIAVGDFDPDVMETQIKQRFGDLAGPARPRARDAVPVPHDQPLAITSATDPELQASQISITDKLDHRPELSRTDYRRGLVESLYHAMLRSRLDELRRDPAAPFVFAGSFTASLVRTCDGFVRSATAKQGKVAETLAVLFREIARVDSFGFTERELDRARKTMLARAETGAREWDKVHSDAVADEISRNFLEHEQMPGRAVELDYQRQLLPTVTLAELNHLAARWSNDHGRVIRLSGPAGAALPTDDEIRAIAASAAGHDLTPWVDATPDRPLIAAPLTPGKVVRTAQDEAAGATVWTLANGVRVVVKPTVFQNDAIDISGSQPGGTSLIPDRDWETAQFAAQIASVSGAGDFDAIALGKLLAGKVVNVGVSLRENAQSFGATTRPSDLETALQLLHLRLTAPRRDERAFAAWKAGQIERVRNRDRSPEQQFNDAMTAIRSGNHLRRRPVTAAMIERVDLDKALAVFKQRFSDFGNFTVIIVGNVDPATLQPLVETYLGSLPSTGRKEAWKDIGIKYPTTRVTRTVTAGSEPKSHVSMSFGAPDAWSLDAERDAEVLSRVLQIRLREVLREDLGGVYHVSVGGWVSREPTQRRSFSISFSCDPAKVETLRDAALGVVHEVQKSGIGAPYLDKVKEQLRRGRETDLRENYWWMRQLEDAYWFHDDFTRATSLDGTLARVTSDRVKASARHFFDERTMIFGVLKPAAAPADKPTPAAVQQPAAQQPAAH